MNGFSLLIAVAALGVDVGWEAGPGGQSYYTVHIEKLLLEPLREGQAIVSNVDPNDRNLTRFQIIVGEHAHAISSQPGPSGNDVVQHGWRPGDNGGADYLIQISPERLESLARGSTIIGQIDPKVTDIRKLYIFSGTTQLPRQLPNSGPAPPPKFLGTGGGLRTASGETTQPNDGSPRVGAPQFDNTQFNGGQAGAGQPGGGQYNGAQYNGGQYNGQAGNGNVYGGAQGQPTAVDPRQAGAGDWRTTNPAAPVWPNQPGGAGPDERMLPVPQLQTGQQDRYGYDPRTGYRQPNPPAYSGPTYAPPAVDPAEVETRIAQAKALGALEAKAAEAEAKAAAAEAKAAAALAKPPTKEPEKADNWPLIVTTMMLFTSMAVNVFFGWLAWSFFWRFRDAAGDATRAQTTLFPNRQAA